jgi:hypothetical protein
MFWLRHFRVNMRLEAEEATSMTFIKPLNLIAIGATFVFLGAIVFGVF